MRALLKKMGSFYYWKTGYSTHLDYYSYSCGTPLMVHRYILQIYFYWRIIYTYQVQCLIGLSFGVPIHTFDKFCQCFFVSWQVESVLPYQIFFFWRQCLGVWIWYDIVEPVTCFSIRFQIFFWLASSTSSGQFVMFHFCQIFCLNFWIWKANRICL